MPFAIHDGDRIHYETYGEGPPLIIQHGLFSSGADMSYPQFVEAVSGTFRMIFTDSLGHGESDMNDDPSHYTMEHRAGDICAVLDAEGIERAHYFGYSMGGWIGTAMAKYNPERLLSLCVAGWPVDRTPSPEMARSPVLNARRSAQRRSHHPHPPSCRGGPQTTVRRRPPRRLPSHHSPRRR